MAAMDHAGLVSLAVHRGLAGDFYNLGCWLRDSRRWAAAAVSLARAVELAPADYRALTNFGWNLHLSGRTTEGLEYLGRAIELAPGESMPYALRAQLELVLGDDEAAVADGRRAVELEPGSAINHMAYSFALLNAGEYGEGWREYEWRFAYRIPEFLNARPYRLWRGERVGHLYIEGEQGLGDTIFGLRWLSEAAARADRVTLYVHKELWSLLVEWGNLPGNVSVYPMPRVLPEAEAWVPVMSLPAALEADRAEACGAYIWGGWKDRGRFRDIGIVWAGSPSHDQAHHRDCPLVYFLRLAEIAGVRLHALQLGTGQEQIGELGLEGLVADRSPEIGSMLDTARIMAGLDLVISVDTSSAHLAGALGVPCLLLLNQRGRDFRWGVSGEASRWYASHRQFRRGLGEDWGALMDRVAAELRR